MSLSWSVHFCQDDEVGGASSVLPEVEDDDAAGVAAIAAVEKLRRGVEIARNEVAESSGNSPSRQGGGGFWSAREQGAGSAPPLLFKYRRLHNGQIRNQRLDRIGAGILWRAERDKQ